MNLESRLQISLLTLRFSIFLVMFMWTLDKFINPRHAGGVYEHFYGIAGLGKGALVAIGFVEMCILVGFLLGAWKRITYGAVLILHAISTLSSFRQYLNPFHSLLFFAAWPMLAGCLALYLMREQDVKCSL